MAQKVLLLGNGINSINNNKSWEALLQLLHQKYYDPAVPFEEIRQKPFPLVYEQIVLWQLKHHKHHQIESVLKKLIAREAGAIAANNIHRRIEASALQHIITSNYEFTLLKDPTQPLVNNGCVKETLYSVFRNYKSRGKTYWHLHGDVQHTNSINLGYEHYCGQLQKMREYTTGKYAASDKKITGLFSQPLVNRPYLQKGKIYSWIDFFFSNHTTIRIAGFRMDLEELDIWWLLTYRAKIIYGVRKGLTIPFKNKVQYCIPKQFTTDDKGRITDMYKTKKALLEGMNIEVVEIDQPHGEDFYKRVLQRW